MNATKYATNVIHMIPVEEIQVAPFNPASRVEEKYLRKLLADIRSAGRIIMPLLIASDGILADGHRRLACAKKLGMERVPVIFAEGTAAELYALGNNATKPQGGQAWAQAVAQGYPLDKVINTDHRSLIKQWMDALGPEDFAEMAARRSDDIVRVARTTLRMIQRTNDMDALRAVLLWLDKHNMARAIIEARKAGISGEAIERAIAEDRPLRQYWA